MLEQLHEDWERSQLTLPQLIKRAGLKLSKSSVSRKLRGKQPLLATEHQALAAAIEQAIAQLERRQRAREARA